MANVSPTGPPPTTKTSVSIRLATGRLSNPRFRPWAALNSLRHGDL
jgi:hypothetical protein